MAMGVAAIKGDGLAGRQSQEMGEIDQYGIRVISRPKKEDSKNSKAGVGVSPVARLSGRRI